MNTYRGYVLDVSNALQPAVHVVYVQGEKYGDAWHNGRAAVDTAKREAEKAARLYNDVECKTRFTSHGDKFTFVRCDDMRARNVKLDRAALAAIIGDASKTDAERMAAVAAMVGAK